MKKLKKQLKKKQTKIEYFATPYFGLNRIKIYFKRGKKNWIEQDNICWLLEAQADFFMVLVWYWTQFPQSIKIYKLDSKEYYYTIKRK